MKALALALIVFGLGLTMIGAFWDAMDVTALGIALSAAGGIALDSAIKGEPT